MTAMFSRTARLVLLLCSAMAYADSYRYQAKTAEPEADLAFNRAQYEPAIRAAWTAAHSFDRFVEAKLGQHCPAPRTYAVWGSGWRYEVAELAPTWPRASQSADLDVQIIGGSYAPQDGRYQFDFAAVSTDFDTDALASTIEMACSDYRRIGEQFLAAARRSAGGQDAPPADGFQLQNQANASVSAINTALSGELQAATSGWSTALYLALISAEAIE